jgi:hypothetical protein
MPDDDCLTSGSLVRLDAQLPNEIPKARNKDKDKTFGNSSVFI